MTPDPRTILLTGLPRSGTTLICALLNETPNTVALAEPMRAKANDRDAALEEIHHFAKAARIQAMTSGNIPTKQRHGRFLSNFVEEPDLAKGELRSVLGTTANVAIRNPIDENFRLFIKHPASFTALADELRQHYQMYIILRHPLAVLASWQTVDMPINRGRLPMAERVDPMLRARLDETPDRLNRQIVIMKWALEKYSKFPEHRRLRYEDVIFDPVAALKRLVPEISRIGVDIHHVPARARYPAVDFDRLADRLAPLEPLIRYFYAEGIGAEHL